MRGMTRQEAVIFVEKMNRFSKQLHYWLELGLNLRIVKIVEKKPQLKVLRSHSQIYYVTLHDISITTEQI